MSRYPVLKPMIHPQYGSFWFLPSLVRFPQMLHPYAYVYNNPVNWIDPSGLLTVSGGMWWDMWDGLSQPSTPSPENWFLEFLACVKGCKGPHGIGQERGPEALTNYCIWFCRDIIPPSVRPKMAETIRENFKKPSDEDCCS